MDLRNLVEAHLDLPRLSKDLGEIGAAARLWSIHQWTRADMAKLWEAAKAFRQVSLDDFVPPSTPPLVEVIHEGKNSRRLYTHFQKRFCKRRDPAESNTLVGYTHRSLSIFAGPGYCVAHPSAEPGEIDLDYTLVPSERAAGWPDIPPNQGRFGRQLYGGIVEVVRGLSAQVSIGRASKDGRWQDDWFVLVRDDVGAASDVSGALDASNRHDAAQSEQLPRVSSA